MTEESGCGSFAVCSADTDRIGVEMSEVSEHIGALDDRDAEFYCVVDFGIAGKQGGCDDKDIRTYHILGLVAHLDVYTELTLFLNDAALKYVAAGDLISERHEYLGDREHTGSSDTDEVYSLCVFEYFRNISH